MRRPRLKESVRLTAQPAWPHPDQGVDPDVPVLISGVCDVVDWIYGAPGAPDVLVVDCGEFRFDVMGRDLPDELELYDA